MERVLHGEGAQWGVCSMGMVLHGEGAQWGGSPVGRKLGREGAWWGGSSVGRELSREGAPWGGCSMGRELGGEGALWGGCSVGPPPAFPRNPGEDWASQGQPKGKAEITRVQFLGVEDPLEQGTATHSSFLAWRIPRTEEPGGLHTVHGVARVRHSLVTKPQPDGKHRA